MHFDIDFHDLTPFDHFWRGTGFSPAELILTPDMQQSLAWAGSVPHHGIRYYRVHFLLELVEFRLSASGQPEYGWDAAGPGPGSDPEKRGETVLRADGQSLRLFQQLQRQSPAAPVEEPDRRIGPPPAGTLRAGEEVLSWYFETWNEPDANGWWTQWPADEGSFCHYYDACAAGLWEVEPRLRLGGPGTCRHHIQPAANLSGPHRQRQELFQRCIQDSASISSRCTRKACARTWRT